MFQSWKEAIEKNKAFRALMTDSSKTFDCLNPDLLIANLHANLIKLPAKNKVNSKMPSFDEYARPELSENRNFNTRNAFSEKIILIAN